MPQFESPSLAAIPRSGGGGSQPDGPGAGERGREREGGVAIPLDTPDPRYAEYFLEVKKRIEAHLVYPQEAARRQQAGQLVLEFVIRRDGSIGLLELVRTSGVGILDRNSLRTVQLAAPFPPIPARITDESLPVSASFTYVLDRGFRFWLR